MAKSERSERKSRRSIRSLFLRRLTALLLKDTGEVEAEHVYIVLSEGTRFKNHAIDIARHYRLAIERPRAVLVLPERVAFDVDLCAEWLG